MFLVNGSLLMTPLFPRSGPGESGSPMSQVISRCYDFPFTHPRSLICFASGVHALSSVRVSQLTLALSEGRRMPSGPGSMFSRRPNCRLALTWARAGSLRFPGDPSCAFAPVSDPGRTVYPSPSRRFRRCCPRTSDDEGFGLMRISGLLRGFSTCCLRFKNGVATIHARLASGWLARLYREGVEPSGSR